MCNPLKLYEMEINKTSKTREKEDGAYLGEFARLLHSCTISKATAKVVNLSKKNRAHAKHATPTTVV